MKLHVALNPNCKNKESPEATSAGWHNVECDLDYLMNWVSQGLAWAATHFSGRYRSGANAYGSNMLVVDVDGDVTLEAFQSCTTARQYCYATYTSCSHNPEGEHRFRAIFQMEGMLESTLEHRGAYQWLSERLCTDLDIDKFEDNSGAKPERLWYGNSEAVLWRNPDAVALPMFIAQTALDEGNWEGVVTEASDQELEQCRYLLDNNLIRHSEDGEYDYWSKITAACSSTGEALFPSWLQWCERGHHGSNSSNAEYNCSVSKYRSFNRGSWVSLFAEAKRQHGEGWKKRLFPESLMDRQQVDPLPDLSDMPEYIQARAQVEHDNLEHLAQSVGIPEPEPEEVSDEDDFEDWMESIRERCHGRDGATQRSADFEAIGRLMPGLCFNTLTQRMEWTHRSGEVRQIEGNYLAKLTSHYSVVHRLFIPEQRIAAAVEYRASRNEYCPIQSYLNSVSHLDDYEHWDDLAYQLLGISDEETRAVGNIALQRFLVGAVARAFSPGCAMDWMPILVGAQGQGKSQFAAHLVPQKLFKEVTMSMKKLQAEPYNLHMGWMLELPEVDALFKADMTEEFKNLVSTREDSFRRPYDRYPSALQRKFCFLGTTNAHKFLKDESGNRRFIPMKLTVGREVNWRQLITIRDRLWATAIRKYNEGATYIYTAGEIAKMKSYFDQFYITDTWIEDIDDLVKGMPWTTVPAILKGLGIEVYQRNDSQVRRVEKCLRELGWEEKRKRINGNKNATKQWHPPEGEFVEETF